MMSLQEEYLVNAKACGALCGAGSGDAERTGCGFRANGGGAVPGHV